MTKGRWIALGVVAVIVLIAIGLSLFNWNLLRGFVDRRVTAATGRQFSIQGNLQVHLGWTSRVRLEQVTLANAPWGEQHAMFRANVIALRVRLWPLLTGRLVMPEITLVKPHVLLEANAEGQRNWEFKTHHAPSKGPAPVIGALNIQDGVLRFRDPQIGTNLRFALDTVAQAQATGPNLAVRGTGTFKGEDFSVNGRVGSLLMLRDVKHPYPFDAQGQIGKTHITLSGTLTDPFHFTGTDLHLALAGPDLAKLHPIVGIPFPSTPPYRLSGQVVHQGRVWRFKNITGHTGSSDIGGDLSVDSSNKKPILRADLHSRELRFGDLASIIGGTPPTKEASVEQRREAKRNKKRSTVLPDKPFNLEKLNAVQADVRLRAEHLVSPVLPVDDLNVHARLHDGVLTFDPLRFGVAGGDLAGTLTLNAHRDPMRTHGDLVVRRLELQRMVPKVKHVARTRGRVGGQIKLATDGNSIAQMAAHADGKIGLIVTGGKVSNLLVELSEIDIGRTLQLLLGGDKDEPVNCGVANFSVDNGALKTQILVVDTPGTRIVGHGDVNLATEQLNLKLEGKPKHPSLLAAPSPIHIRGTFKKPDIGASKSLFARGGAAIALGALAGPLAALAPLISTGPAHNTACGALIQETRSDVSHSHPRK